MINEAIVLAGGLGTRIRSVIGDIPKPMADINGKPFLEYILIYLLKNGIKKVILSVGYRHELIINYFGNHFKNIEIFYCIEEKPLGTGGAIKKSLNYVNSKDVLMINGDTFFPIVLSDFYKHHKESNADISIALKEIKESDRYGSVKIDANNKIIGFQEKELKVNRALINGGVYLINKDIFCNLTLPNEFSFERDFLEKYFNIYQFYGFVYNAYFIDIGIPQDYDRAKKEFKIISF